MSKMYKQREFEMSLTCITMYYVYLIPNCYTFVV